MNIRFVRYNGEVESIHPCSSASNLSKDKIYEVVGTNSYDLETGEWMPKQTNLKLREVNYRSEYKEVEGEYSDWWFNFMPVELAFMINDAPEAGRGCIKFTTLTPRPDGQSLMPRTCITSRVVDYQVYSGVYRVITRNKVYLVRVFM